jgi:hypothetical protein
MSAHIRNPIAIPTSVIAGTTPNSTTCRWPRWAIPGHAYDRRDGRANGRTRLLPAATSGYGYEVSYRTCRTVAWCYGTPIAALCTPVPMRLRH